MRIGINAFFSDKPHTGSGQYLTNLLRHLTADGQHEYVLIEPGGPRRQQHQKPAASMNPSRDGLRDGRARVRQRRISALLAKASGWAETQLPENSGKLLFEQFSVPARCRAERLDLLHLPYYGPPVPQPCPTIVTIHDLIMLAMPEHQVSALVRWYNGLVAIAAKRADMIIADSVATKKDIVRFLNIEERRIRVVYLACDETMRPVRDVNSLDAIRREHHLDRPFIFYIGGLDRRKNVDTLINAVALAPGDWTLAIAGQVRTDNPRIFPDLRRVASEAGVADRVRFLGLVPEEDKPALYSAADLFVFPSLYEGFGLSPLEAMACGAPVLCSNASSLPEVVGDGGLLFDPADTAGLARLIAETMASPAARADLGRRGMRRAEDFSWQNVATATRRIYEEVHVARRKDCASPGFEAD